MLPTREEAGLRGHRNAAAGGDTKAVIRRLLFL